MPSNRLNHAADPGRRWMQPNARRFLKPMPWERTDDFERRCADAEGKSAPRHLSVPARGRAEAVERFGSDVLSLKAELLALRWEFTARRLLEKYRPDQPRVPAGNPNGGQWTAGAGSIGTTDPRPIQLRRRGRGPHGHHFVPFSLYSKHPFRPETRELFENAKTGKLYGKPHINSVEHFAYNKAVEAQFNAFKLELGVEAEDMTPNHAREFLRRVLTSRNPVIRDLNRRVLRQRLFFQIMRRAGRGE